MAKTDDLPQHLQALANANKVRLARAELKRKIWNGEVLVGDVILDPPWEAESMTVADLLMSQWRWGRDRARKMLQKLPVTEMKEVGKMTDRQRRVLVELLPPNAKQRDN